MLSVKFTLRIKRNLRLNHVIAIPRSDCFLVLWESDVIGRYNKSERRCADSTFSLGKVCTQAVGIFNYLELQLNNPLMLLASS